MKTITKTGKLLLLSFFLLSISSYSQTQPWAKQISGAYNASKITSDRNGNVYVLGQYFNSIQIGGITYTSKGGYDLFLASFNGSTGEHRWSRSIGGPNGEDAKDIEYDQALNSVWLLGTFSGTTSFPYRFQFPDDATVLKSAGGKDIFVARYELRSGTLQSLSRVGGALDDVGEGLGVCNRKYSTSVESRVYLTGYTQGTTTFETFDSRPFFLKGSTTLRNNTSGLNTFVAELINSGTAQNIFNIGTCTSEDSGKDIAADSDGNIYITGKFNGDFNLGSRNIKADGIDGYIIKLDRYNSIMWVKIAGGSSTDYPEEIKVGKDKYIYTTGTTFSKPFTITANGIVSKTLQYVGGGDVYVTSHSREGELLGADLIGGVQGESPMGLATDGSGNAYVTGTFIGSAKSVGNRRTVSAIGGVNDKDIFVFKYTPSLISASARSIGSSLFDAALDVTVTSNNDVIIIARTQGELKWGTTPTIRAGSTFIANMGIRANAREESEDEDIDLAMEDHTNGNTAIASPNPFENNFSISFPSSVNGTFKAQLYGMEGTKLLDLHEGVTEEGGRNTFVVNGAALPSGIYNVRIVTTSGVINQKIIKR